MLVLGFYNMTYCHSSWEFLNELKWGLFIPVLYSLTIWLASLFKCIAGDRANGESSASQQQVSIFKKKKTQKTPTKIQTKQPPKPRKKWTKRTRKFPSVAFSRSCNIPMKRRSLTIFLYMYWARFYSLNSNIYVSSSEMGPYFRFLKERNLVCFSLQVHGFPAKFMKFWLVVTSPVRKAIKKSEGNKWVCRSINMAHLGILLLNTRIIFCIEAYLLEMENHLL